MVSPAEIEGQIANRAAAPVISRDARLVVVVGFDGSDSAGRALAAAATLISGRVGTVEVVFVAHLSSGAELSADSIAESLKAFDRDELNLLAAVHDRLADVEYRWHFQRRDGPIAHELVAVAEELAIDYGDDAQVVIVVGTAMHTIHRVVGSVPVALVRNGKYPVVVVP